MAPSNTANETRTAEDLPAYSVNSFTAKYPDLYEKLPESNRVILDVLLQEPDTFFSVATLQRQSGYHAVGSIIAQLRCRLCFTPLRIVNKHAIGYRVHDKSVVKEKDALRAE